ncbi:MAG: hypothetical protein ACRDRL_32555 [Sciscionella sp.]
MSRFRGDPEAVEQANAKQSWQAAKTVAHHATSSVDCADLLAMLGIEDTHKPEPEHQANLR